LKLLNSAEDYLETILLLKRKTGCVRSIDIANDLGYSKASVSVAMKKLRQNNLILVDDEGYINLTNQGELTAANVYERHSTLYDWLQSLGVDEAQSAVDACRMEHVISEASFRAIKTLYEKALAER